MASETDNYGFDVNAGGFGGVPEVDPLAGQSGPQAPDLGFGLN